ncbi:MAG TPA: NAD-binding protein [Thermoanaerobaculia bacterium]|nr:NAD-binding protein [Thermoanaerobaculia bacterium]
MKRSQRRLVGLMIAVPLFVVLSGAIYMEGMARLEGKSRSFWQAVEWAAETLSTTGYGYDSQWSHPVMVLFVIGVQFAGVFLVFLIIPIYLVPFLEERFEERLPRQAPAKLHGHVIVYRYGPAVEMLLERLRSARVPALVVERDEQVARSLVDRELPVVFSREEEDSLDICNLGNARAVVANGRDEENGALILRARQLGFRGAIYALVEEPAHRRPMELAGATAAYTPRHILAAALATRVSERISPRLPGLEQLDGLELREFRVRSGTPLIGSAFSDSSLAAAGAILAGQWTRGKLSSGGPSVRLESGSILLLLGSEAVLGRIAAEDAQVVPLASTGPFLVAGFGEVGMKVHELLTDAGDEVLAIDRAPRANVSVVGNVLDPYVLRSAGIERARAVVLALDSDDATLFATVIVRDTVASIPIIARVNHARNIDNIYRAGADYALSISEVSGQMLLYRLLGDQRLTGASHLRVHKRSAAGFTGRHPDQVLPEGSEEISVIAIRRGKSLISSFAPDLRLQPEDDVYFCGSEDGIRLIREVG